MIHIDQKQKEAWKIIFLTDKAQKGVITQISVCQALSINQVSTLRENCQVCIEESEGKNTQYYKTTLVQETLFSSVGNFESVTKVRDIIK